ncbi:MAG: metallophosphoesterase, partial [Pseudomonadota bacterium]
MMWFKSKTPKRLDSPAGPKDKRAYAIGDIHGRYDLLDALLRAIKQDAADRPNMETHLISLGDLIDRGPESDRVVECFSKPVDGFTATHVLMGNHEEMLVRGIRGEANSGAMTPETVLRLGAAAGHYFRRDARAHSVVIGKDTRRSGYML